MNPSFQMENTIFQSVWNLLDCNQKIKMAPYKDNLTEKIDGLYMDADTRNRIKTLYSNLLSSRKNLSEFGCVEFKDSDFNILVRKYLSSVIEIMQYLFKRTNETQEAVGLDIIQQIVETDIEDLDKGVNTDDKSDKIKIGIGNPIILESLAVEFNQNWDYANFLASEAFKKKYNAEDQHTIFLLYFEILQICTERLFRDIQILHDKEYYHIIDIDTSDFRFIAVREDDLSSIEQFNAIRLYDMIIERQGVGVPQKSVIIGSLKEQSVQILESMIETWQSEKGIVKSRILDFRGKKKDVDEIINDSCKFTKLLNDYDKIFFMDCPGIYTDLYIQGMRDSAKYMDESKLDWPHILGIDENKKVRDFNNSNTFVTIYYRVQNYLMNRYALNADKARNVNIRMLDFTRKMFERDDKGNLKTSNLANKEIYFFYSNGESVAQSGRYDMYDFTRIEIHNAKSSRLIKFSDKNRDKELSTSDDKKIKINYFKILEAISCSGTFYCEMTADSCSSLCEDSSRVLNAIYIAKNTEIEIEYSPCSSEKISGKSIFHMSVEIKIPHTDMHGMVINIERSEKYYKIIYQILLEAFTDVRESVCVGNIVLFEQFHKIFVNVLYRCATNYNDLLFCHLCERLYNIGDVILALSVVSRKALDIRVSGVYTADELCCCSKKKTASYIMNVLDSESYRESEAIALNHRALLNQDNLSDHIDNIKASCNNLRYVDSKLFFRINKYF